MKKPAGPGARGGLTGLTWPGAKSICSTRTSAKILCICCRVHSPELSGARGGSACRASFGPPRVLVARRARYSLGCRRLVGEFVIASARFSVLRTTPKEGNEGCAGSAAASRTIAAADRTHAAEDQVRAVEELVEHRSRVLGGPGDRRGQVGGVLGGPRLPRAELGVGPKSRSRAESGMRAVSNSTFVTSLTAASRDPPAQAATQRCCESSSQARSTPVGACTLSRLAVLRNRRRIGRVAHYTRAHAP
jgi:hypothetical protein